MQHFIFVTITTYGPLMCSIVTTTRKFFTVLASVMVFGHALFAHQWLGTVLVFGGLLLDTLYGKGGGKKPAGGHSCTGAANGCSHCSCHATQLRAAGAGDVVDAHAHVDSSADLQATAALAPEAQATVDPEMRKQL